MTKGGLQKQKLKRQARDDIIEDDVTNEADAAAGSANTLVADEEKAVSKLPKKELSKRQRRKLPNDKHKWPQHPKIQSMEARHKAYIRTAGLGSVLANDSKDDDDGNSNKKKRKGKSNDKKKVKKSAISDFIDPSLDIMSPEVKFGRVLGGADQRSRHAAVLKLKQYLRARCDINNDHGGLSEMDLLKLFKGLWFTLYMCDKVPVQDELSKKLASLIWCVAGTEEEDEYAGQAYLDLCSYNEGDIGGDDDEFDGGDIAEDESSEERVGDDDSSSDDDEEEIAMHEIYNSLAIQGSDDEAEPEDDSVEGESNAEDSSELEEDEAGADDIEEQDEMEMKHCRGAHLASLFVKTFFHTIRREWGKMDKYRVDKFYTLIRLYIHEVFEYMAKRHWNIGIIRLFNDTIFDEVLSKTPNGLRYHLIDPVMEELAKVNAKAALPLTEATFLDTMEPYFAMAQTGAGGDDSVQARVLEKIFSKFLDEFSVVSDAALELERNQNELEDKEGAKTSPTCCIFDEVHVKSVAKFIFEMAGDADTPDRYRKSLYDMHKKYMRRVKKIGRDVELPGLNGEGEQMEEREVETNDSVGGEEEENLDVLLLRNAETKKKSKKRHRDNRSGTDNASQDDTSKLEDISPDGGKKSKRKKVKTSSIQNAVQKAQASTNEDDNAGNEWKGDDEVVTISIQEQKRARAKASKTTKKGDGNENNSKPATGSSERRVKFTATNRSKSWKASMKALVTTTPPKTSVTTPEKSILLNKGAGKRPGMTKKAGRKRAINYF